MVRHILENLAEPLAAEDVARVVGLHPNYALNLFTSVMHVPIHKFVIRMRLIRARALLFEGNLSIENVAFQSGLHLAQPVLCAVPPRLWRDAARTAPQPHPLSPPPACRFSPPCRDNAPPAGL